MADDCDKQIALEPCATVTRAVCVRKLGDACSRNALAVRACVDGRRGPTEVIYELDGDTLMAGYTSTDIVACPVEVRFCMQDGEQGGGGGGGGGGGDATALNQTSQIALQNDQIDEAIETNRLIGATNEATAAADNSASGLNGLIKRLLGKFGTLVNGSAPVRVSAKQVTWTNRSNTITLGGTAQSLAAANSAREGFEIINLSTGDLWFNDQGTATLTQPSYRLSAGQSYTMPLNGVSTAALSIIGATTAQAFSAREW